MATIPPPGSIPEAPPFEPGTGGDDVGAPPPDIDIPDPGDPNEAPGETEAHPS